MATLTGSARNDVQNAINPAPSAAANMPKDGLPIMHQSLHPCLPPRRLIYLETENKFQVAYRPTFHGQTSVALPSGLFLRINSVLVPSA